MIKIEQKIKELEAEIARLRSSVNELKILNDIALTSGRATDIDQVLNLIVQKCISVIHAEQGSILLATENEKEPFKTIIRRDDSSSLKHNYRIGSNITGWVLLNREPLVIENLSKDKRFEPSEEEKKDIHSILCVPIWFEGTIIGIMMLINKKFQKHFSPSDLTLFSIISVQAGQLIKNLQLQKEKFQKIKEAEKLQELDKLKTIFFTNISHEFRTPLTLILGPVEQILKKSSDDQTKENAMLIQRSAKKLNRLADQLLDLAKIEAGKLKLKTSRQNLLEALAEIIGVFRPFAESKKIYMNFNAPNEPIYLYIDRDKFDNIISNVLSNALKFTPQLGVVNINANIQSKVIISNNEFTEGCAEIVISDTGIGIPQEQLEKIFERFYQVDHFNIRENAGSGVGLALTKELVDLHKGKIIAESEEGKGAAFKIYLPLGKNHLKPEDILTESENEAGNNLQKIFIDPLNEPDKVEINFLQGESKPVLLIIEDNNELRDFIKGIMNELYDVEGAANGEEGLRKSFEIIPDIIISDVMMPKLNGYSLCKMLKSDARTSHIPLILLTAKSGITDKVVGLETGADDYITKPFIAEELKARIKNLLAQRERLHEHFQNKGLFEIDGDKITPVDRKFLNKAMEILNEDICDTSFGVEQFAGSLAVSRSLLHKKLVSLAGLPPGELIKRFRLNKAAMLLENKFGSVTEVAFEVGFNDLSYFTVCFKKQFGISPSQYHHNIS